MPDSNSFVFGALAASSSSFSYGSIDVKGGTSCYSYASATNSDLPSSTPTTLFSQSFSSLYQTFPTRKFSMVKGGRRHFSSRASTMSSATHTNLPSPTLTAPFPNPFSSPNLSIPPLTPDTSGDGQTRTCPALSSSASPNYKSTTISLHTFSCGESVSLLVSNRQEQIVESVSSDKGEKSGKDARSPQQTTRKDKKAVSMEDTSESIHCPPLALIPISRLLKGIPHSPHFLQLRSYSEMARKMLMNGWDRVFEETVEEMYSLSAKEFWARASQLCKTMEELNGLGYNVFPLRKRLVELAAVMEEQKSSKLEISRLKSKAESHRMEESRLEILGLQQRARRQQAAIWELRKEVEKMEKDLPKFDEAFNVLAMASFFVPRV